MLNISGTDWNKSGLCFEAIREFYFQTDHVVTRRILESANRSKLADRIVLQHRTILYYLYVTIHRRSVLHCIAMQHNVLQCIAMQCNAMYCNATKQSIVSQSINNYSSSFIADFFSFV